MRFELDSEQQAFGDSLDALVAGSDPIGVTRAWADDDHAPGLKLWQRLAEQGVHALLVPEESGGMGATPVELAVAFEVLGRYAVPGPWVESVAYLATATSGDASIALAQGQVATVAAPPHTPYALDADVAEQVWLADSDDIWPANVGASHTSVDRTRHLFTVDASLDNPVAPLNRAFDMAALATSAQLLGLGERVLADSVTYVQQRKQFGRPIGSYQAIKHMLADVRIALDFARPLLFGAALSLVEPLETSPRSVSAAKVQCAEAAYLASRVGLQVHGAIGYTEEYDLSVFLTKIRALVTAWGTPAFHRARILESLAPSTSSGTE